LIYKNEVILYYSKIAQVQWDCISEM